MDWIICDSSGMEKARMPTDTDLDFEIGGDSEGDVCVTTTSDLFEIGDYLICPGTEYGAQLLEMEVTTDSNERKFYGDSFRKMISQVIIQPPDGEDYRIVSGNAVSIMKSLLGPLQAFFEAGTSDITIPTYQFARYCTALAGFTAMLKTQDAKIQILIHQGAANAPFSVVLDAAPIVDYSKEIEFSEDSKAVATLTDNRRGITHLICLGQGELKDRQVVHLYAWPDGTVQQKQYYTGLEERQATYDNTAAESLEELIKGGTDRLKELASGETLSVSVSDMDLDIGDLIGGRSYKYGFFIVKPISGKVIQVQNGQTSITLSVQND